MFLKRASSDHFLIAGVLYLIFFFPRRIFCLVTPEYIFIHKSYIGDVCFYYPLLFSHLLFSINFFAAFSSVVYSLLFSLH